MSSWVLLDVNGTLTDPGPIGDPWGRPDLGSIVLEHAVHTGMVDALLGTRGRRFSDHLKAAIEVIVADVGLDPAGVDAAVAAAARLPARPDAAEALAMLVDAGSRLVPLTNSGARAGEATLESCGLLRYVDRVLGVDAVETFKPDPKVYGYAVAQVGARPRDLTLIATHPWDLAGAASAGISTAWVRHGARGWPAVFPAPDFQAETLLELARALV
jgi:2-haloacid dehalogenase